MSTWTYLKGNIFLYKVYEEKYILKEIKEILGKIITNENLEEDDTTLPLGSEGSLKYQIFEGDNNIEIIFTGNLRDYDDLENIKKWVKIIVEKLKKLKGISVEDFFFKVYVNGKSLIIFANNYDESKPYFRILEEI